GAGTTAAETPTETAAPAGTRLTLSADPGGALAFDTQRLEAPAGPVTLVMTNPSSATAPHAIAIEGGGIDEDGETVRPGGTSEVSA
ncbi:hypothetical protein OFB63_33405, partial [Escherichia coli]|nr:hypothetical protein [Escherichia coli]